MLNRLLLSTTKQEKTQPDKEPKEEVTERLDISPALSFSFTLFKTEAKSLILVQE